MSSVIESEKPTSPRIDQHWRDVRVYVSSYTPDDFEAVLDSCYSLIRPYVKAVDEEIVAMCLERNLLDAWTGAFTTPEHRKNALAHFDRAQCGQDCPSSGA